MREQMIEPIGSPKSPLTRNGFDEGLIVRFMRRAKTAETARNRNVALRATDRKLPKESLWIPVPAHWAGNGKIAPKEQNGGDDKPQGPPAEPRESVLNANTLTLVILSGPHPGKSTQEIANRTCRRLNGCKLATADPLKRDAESNGAFVLLGGQWIAKDLASILGNLKFSCRGFASLAKMKGDKGVSRKIIHAVEYDLSRL